MTDAELQQERREDDRWTTPKLLGLAVGTLTIALGIIYYFAAQAAPY